MGLPASAVVLCVVLVLAEAVDVPNPLARFRDASRLTARQNDDDCLSYLAGLSTECREALQTSQGTSERDYAVLCSGECYPSLYEFFNCTLGDVNIDTLESQCSANSDGVLCHTYLTDPTNTFANESGEALAYCDPLLAQPNQCSDECNATLAGLASAYGCCVNTLLNIDLSAGLFSSIVNETLWTTCGLDYPGFCDEPSTGTPTTPTEMATTPSGAASVGCFVGLGVTALLLSVWLPVI